MSRSASRRALGSVRWRAHYRPLLATRRCMRYERDKSDGFPRAMLSARSNSSSEFSALSLDRRSRWFNRDLSTLFATDPKMVTVCAVECFDVWCHWHQTPAKKSEKGGKPVNSDLPQTLDRQADLIRFVQLARSTESHFETARFNHSRTSPNLGSIWFPNHLR